MASITDLNKIFITTPEKATPELAAECMEYIMTAQATDAQIAAFLLSLRFNKFDLNSKYIAACAKVMRSKAVNVDTSDYADKIVDIVGTGGDGHDTFNVSTTAGLVAAAAGCYVTKHGNVAASSKSGSANILEKAGVMIRNIKPDMVKSMIERNNYCFLFAQTYHPAMRFVGPVRKQLVVSTIFNYLGPLNNPCHTKRMVVGVHSTYLGQIVAEALMYSGVERGMVVCGDEGLDEISPECDTHVWEIENGTITKKMISPEDFGLERHPLDSENMKGGDAEENAQILKELFNNERKDTLLDWVLMNAAALCYVAGLGKDFKECMKITRDAVESGKAKVVLENLIKDTQA